MYVINKTKQGVISLPAKQIGTAQIKAISSALAYKIASELAKKPSYPKEIAKRLGVHEQKVYYHIRNLEKAKIIEISKKEVIQGAAANIYSLTTPAFAVLFQELKATQKLDELEAKPVASLEPFVENGQLNAAIIVGSPDPHGPEKARSRDGYYGIDFALFLGSFLNYIPELNVKLDTEARKSDLDKNLILIGGPVVNTVTAKINNKLPVRFEKEDNWAVLSTVTGKKYHSDETGIIVRAKNPFNPKKEILLIAGKRYAGTRAVMIAFLKHFSEVVRGNKFSNKIKAKIVEGVDLNSDGIVDDIEILE